MQWTEKHRPKNLSEIKGQFSAIQKVKEFLQNPLSKKRAIILHGPPGTGKTTLAHAFANETNSEIFELNASDLRNKNKLQEILKPAIEQKSLTKTNKIILVDEVDGISVVDRGGLTELISLIETSRFPIIITANDIWSKKLSSLRKKSELVQLKEIDYRTTKETLISILNKENKFIQEQVLTKISINAKGDLRAAINDLQSISQVELKAQEDLDERNKEESIFNILKTIFQQKPTNELLQIFDSTKMPLDEIILWVEENIPLEYSGEELARAYHKLSKVDIFKRRIYRQQYWRFLVYENIFLSYGISASKKQVKSSFTNYKRPSRILKIWLNNQRTQKKKSISQKYARKVHIGQKRAMQEFSIIRQIINSNKKIQQELKLNEEEIEYLNKF